jgi:hypothetical protein
MAAGPFDYPIHTGTNITGSGLNTTVSVATGDTVVVGALTLWLSVLQPGDIFLAGGHVNLVRSIQDDTHLTLGVGWTGPTLTDQPYVIQRWLQHTDGRWIGYTITEYFSRVEAVPTELQASLDAGTAARDAALAAQAAAEGARDAAATSLTDAQAARDATLTARDDTTAARDVATGASTDAAAALAAANTARDATLTAYDNFDDRYLGSKPALPTTDNDGAPLQDGAVVWLSTATPPHFMSWSVTLAQWVDPFAPYQAALDLVADEAVAMAIAL